MLAAILCNAPPPLIINAQPLTAKIITKYCLERFLSIGGEKISKGSVKFCKLISNLILGQIIVSNLKNVHKLNSRINYAVIKLDIKTKIKHNNYSSVPFEMQLLKGTK